MQLATHQSVASIGTVAREQRMSIDLDALADIIRPLTDLYSDRMLAFIREYSTNAWDSHLRAGVERPIEVTLPTSDSLYFTVQDFGLGLSADDLADIYSVYGKSLNRGSDLAAGTFGFGSKSALAYASDFSIVAVKDGVRNVVQVEKGNDGIGVLKFLDQRATTEGNGVTVRIPVQRVDFRSVQNKAADFYKYWDQGTVLVDGEEPLSVFDNHNAATIKLDADVFVQRSSGYGDDEHVIVMGQVPYRVAHRDFPGVRDGVKITARVPMGTVTFVPSREALKVNDKVTVETLTELSAYVSSRVRTEAARKLDTAPTLWDRFLIWNSLRKDWGITLPEEYGWKPVPRYYGRPDESPRGFKYEHNSRRPSQVYSVADALLGNATHLVVTHLPFRALTPVVKARIAAYCDANDLPRRALVLIERPTYIDGHPNVITYDDLPVIQREKQQRAKRLGYTWTYFDTKGTGHTYEAPVPQGNVVVYGDNTVPSALHTIPGAHYATLRSNQIDKFLRTFPKARPWYDVVTEKRAEAAKNITADDKLYAGTVASYRFHTVFSNWQDIADPELRHLMAVVDFGPSSTYTAALNVGQSVEQTDITGTLNQYPLITQWRRGYNEEDAILYINTKYNQAQEATAS